MSFTPLGTGVKQGKAKFDGKEFEITWQCYIPTEKNKDGVWVENTAYKNMVEKIACQAAGRAKAGRKYNEITIRAVSHETTRVGGSRSTVFLPDDPHLTIDYGPGPVKAASHVYVGPKVPHNITLASDFANVSIWRKGGKPPISWWDKNN